MRYPVVNLGHSQLSQGRTLLEQACDAINYYNMFPDTDSDSMAAKAAAVAAMRGLFQSAAASTQEDFDYIKDKIRKNCNAGEDLLSQVQLTTPAMTTPYSPVSSTDTGYTPPPLGPGTPGVVNPYKPVATGGFRILPPIEIEEAPPATTGSEPEPEPPRPPQTPPQTPSKPFVPPPPMVATGGPGCYYVPGQGYSWGPRPSGGESTGLNQRDCESIRQRDREVRGIPVENTQAAQTSQVSNQQTSSEGIYNPNAPMAPQGRAPVASTDCSHLGPYAWFDGRQCRPGSVNQSGGSLVSSAMNLGPSGMTTGAVPFGMGGRIPTQPLMTRRF